MKLIAMTASAVGILVATFAGAVLVTSQNGTTPVDNAARLAECHRVLETGTYAQWKAACETINPRPGVVSANTSDGHVGEDYGDSPQNEPDEADDGSDAVVAEMRRQERQRRMDDFSRQERERQQAYTDRYNAQAPQGYDYSK